MSYQLLADCLNEVFEILEGDKITLRSCLLVSHLWCEVSVRILWRNIWSFNVKPAVLRTLIACLPNESKELLNKNGIFISTPTAKPPLFNYATFCKVLSIDEIGQMIDRVLKDEITTQSVKDRLSLIDRRCLVRKEVFKMFMNQISSLKKLTYLIYGKHQIQDIISFTTFPEARACLTGLSELHCSSNIDSKFFHQLSQICHNLQSLNIELNNSGSNELKVLISLQKNLKNLQLSAHGLNNWADIIPALTNHRNTLTKLHLNGEGIYLPLSFINIFSNLQEIDIKYDYGLLYNEETGFEDFKELQYVTFPKLQILRIPYRRPESDYIVKFLEINGKNLEEFYVNNEDNAIYLSIAKFCPNLKKLSVAPDDLDILNTIFNSCQNLESIEITCGKRYLSEKEAFEMVVNHSPRNLYELRIYYDSWSELAPEDLESFFIGWKNRAPKKSLNLVIIKGYGSLEENEENMKIIEKYKNLGIVKKF